MRKSPRPSPPASVRVGPFDYRLDLDWPPMEANAVNAFGQFRSVEMCIKIREDLPPPHKSEVLLHEVLHAIYHTYSIEHAGGEEEKIVTAYSMGLLQVMRDNPDLMLWLAAAARS